MRLPDLVIEAVEIVAKTNAASAGIKRLDVGHNGKSIFIAGAIEEHAAKQVPHRANNQIPPAQHEVAAQLEQRLEVALDVRRPRAESPRLGLHEQREKIARGGDRLRHRLELARGL